MKYRRASHAGSWYKANAKELNEDLAGWLEDAPSSHWPARAIIGPHAGYSYSGPCAAHAYKQIDPDNIERIFLLGPAHHIRLNGCGMTSAKFYCTPFYDILIDHDVYQDLRSFTEFGLMGQEVDEDEHSLEMHLPFIAKVMENRPFKLVPILVGNLTLENEELFGKMFSKYLLDPANLFVISSDFCHWGSRFKYTPYDQSAGQIWESIRKLDKQGMKLIESLNHKKFHDYLNETHNTICGRHPIGILLAAIEEAQKQSSSSSGSSSSSSKPLKFDLKFINYEQSNRCRSMNDSSVSYAAGVLLIG
ncbi:hypothetical protein HELRODRAFT_103432 [Helobdella robusta]|uniref:Mediator of ErbB2-driven cell motility 1 n=1 Tax=Helobdella robusta TaxID=6412 RepID=T1EDG1_HELRO|nr:hypothetical protein HELRODRAFT_103432 [Helobdella robusta]ESN93520.1 hypothetical protein HELRODRAFT_103432 [Helobdella robusta]